MRIGVAVAAAGETEAFPLLVRVARHASKAFVSPIQGEPGFSMVEGDLPERDFGGMAFGALGSQLPAVRVRMAGSTTRILEQV